MSNIETIYGLQMRCINRLHSFLSKQANLNNFYARFYYRVHHNDKRGIFYIKLDKTSRAVLQYKFDGKILDMQRINVPNEYKGQGIARLLAETAFTYAIVNLYYMYLTCDYLQKYYLAVKNVDLEERVIGPPHILKGPGSAPLDPDIIYDIPDPEDMIKF